MLWEAVNGEYNHLVDQQAPGAGSPVFSPSSFWGTTIRIPSIIPALFSCWQA